MINRSIEDDCHHRIVVNKSSLWSIEDILKSHHGTILIHFRWLWSNLGILSFGNLLLEKGFEKFRARGWRALREFSTYWKTKHFPSVASALLAHTCSQSLKVGETCCSQNQTAFECGSHRYVVKNLTSTPLLLTSKEKSLVTKLLKLLTLALDSTWWPITLRLLHIFAAF